MTSTKRFSPEVRERAVRLVFSQEQEHSSQWACIEAIAPKIGCTPQTLRTWVKYRKYKAPVERTPSLILLTGVADLEKFALIDPKTLFAVFGMPFISAHS